MPGLRLGQGNAEGEDSKFVGPVLKLKPQKLPMTFPDRDLEVGILEIESGKPIAVVSLELSAFQGPKIFV